MDKLIVLLSACALVGCASQYGTVTLGFYKEALPSDPGARFGAFAEQTAPVVVDDKAASDDQATD